MRKRLHLGIVPMSDGSSLAHRETPTKDSQDDTGNEFFDGDKTSVLKGMSTRFGSVHPLSAKYLEAICEGRTQEFKPFSNRVVMDKPIPLMVAMTKLPLLMALGFLVFKAMLLILTIL